MIFADIHTHVLAEVDDGTQSEEEMFHLLDECYRNGTRYLCCTPHYHPGYYGNNKEKSSAEFSALTSYAETAYPDMRIYLGNELHYHQGSIEWVKRGDCRTINNTRYLLVDFSSDESANNIEHALEKFLRIGYIPILAHIERYKCFRHHYRRLEKLRSEGVLLQANTASILNLRQHPALSKLLKNFHIDLVASDTHNLTTRPPMMEEAYKEIYDKYSADYANWIFYEHAVQILMKTNNMP